MASALSRIGWVGLLLRFAARLRYRTLFFLTAALFVADLVVPDVVPFADEVLLGLGTLLLGSLKRRNEAGEVVEVDPPR